MEKEANSTALAPSVCLDHLRSFPEARVLCVGDVMVDHFIRGTTLPALSTEAPVPVLNFLNQKSVLGGAGNVFSNLVHLQSNCHLISAVGKDVGGKILSQLLNELGGSNFTLIQDVRRRTTEVTRYIDQDKNHHFLRLDVDTTTPLREDIENQLISTVQSAFSSYDVIIFSDYGKGVLTHRVLQTLLNDARRAGKLTMVDPRGTSMAKYAGAYMLKPNRFELNAISGLPTDRAEQIISASKKLKKKFKFDVVLTTRDAAGMMLLDENNKVFYEPSHAKQIVDDVGAGDTVIATMAISLALKFPFQTAMHLASRAAALAIGKIGTSAISRNEMIISFEETKNGCMVTSLSEAKQILTRWRDIGNRIAFTNGCFDLMHAGHFSSLLKGRIGCDKLIVGLNSDDSIKRNKGNRRPIESQDVRAAALSSLDGIVDLVVLFEEDTPMTLLKELKPDVLFKGRPLDCIVGADFVAGYGGTVLAIPVVPGFSTTKSIEKVKTQTVHLESKHNQYS